MSVPHPKEMSPAQIRQEIVRILIRGHFRYLLKKKGVNS